MRRRGYGIALAAAGFAAWVGAHFLIAGRFPALDPADPELPVAKHTRPDRCVEGDPDVAILRIDARGVVEVDGRRIPPGPDRERRVTAALADVAARMRKEDLVPDGVLCVRADRRASWDDVAEVLRACTKLDVQLWKLHIAARWSEPEVRTCFRVYLPKDVGISCPDPGRLILPARLRLLSSGEAWILDGRAIGGRAALHAGLALAPPEGYLEVEVGPGRAWGEVAGLLDEAALFFQEYELDEIDFTME